MTVTFEGIKYAFRQTKDGHVLSFVVHPNDLTDSVILAPIGSRVKVTLAEITDPPTAKPGPETAPAGGSKTEGERAVTRAALLCKDPRFQAWCGHPGDEAGARFTLLETCDIASRSLLATNADALDAFKQMETDYLIYSGRMAEMRS